jgi:transcriptional regulator with XRE-family HTH domain
MPQMTLGQMIRSARDENGLSQTELGDRVEVSQQYIAKWVCDLSMPRRSSLSNLADVLNIPIVSLRQARDTSLHACQDGEENLNDLMITNINLAEVFTCRDGGAPPCGKFN